MTLHYRVMEPLCRLEREVLERIALQHPDVGTALRSQIELARVVERSNSGVGFFTRVHVSGSPELIPGGSPLGDVAVSAEGLEHGLHFLLFCTDGKASMLEGWTVGNDDTTGMTIETLGYSFDA